MTDHLITPGIGDLDLHLFSEGSHRRLWELLGPQHTDGGIRFGVWAPDATAVSVVGDFSGWHEAPMQPNAMSGIWSIVLPEAKSGERYKFRVRTASGIVLEKADPMARQTELHPLTASVIPEISEFVWGDDSWLSTRADFVAGERSMRVYEVHAMSWRNGVDTWDDLADQLGDHVVDLGFTHIELLPIAEHPFGGSWGYQVSSYYAPTARLGDPDALRRFVDSMHRRGIGVLVDWVPAHFPKDAFSLGRFDGTALYEHDDPRLGEHPDWGTYVFNFGRTEVRNFLVANALYWLEEFHIDGLRVDAVASMLYLDYSRDEGQWIPNEFGGRENLTAVSFLQEVNSVVAEYHPDTMMIAEESTAWPKVSGPVSEGGLGFNFKWNMGWMHDTLQYLEREPVHRKYHHDDLSFTMLYAFQERFLLPLSHDEVVHGKGSLLAKMSGDDWQKFANLRLLYAWQWSVPGPPLLFMGCELAPWSEWNEGGEVPWHLGEHGPHRGMTELIRRLNETTDDHPALWVRDRDPEGFQWLAGDDAKNSTFSFLRWDVDGRTAVVCVANFTPVPQYAYRVGVPWGGDWEVLLDTDATAFSGSGTRGTESVIVASDDIAAHGQTSSVQFDVPPLAMVWLGAQSPGPAPEAPSATPEPLAPPVVD